MARKATNQNVIETLEVIETPDEEVAMNEIKEVIEPEWKATVDALSVEGIKNLMQYCKARLEELQQEEIATLEEQMREIQSKLMNMKGGSALFPKTNEKKKQGKVIINPNNPSEVYGGFGKRPDWLKELLKPAGGDMVKEQAMLEEMRQK